MAALVMIGKTKQGDAQANDRSAGQEYQDEHQGPVHLGQVKLDNFSLTVPFQADGLPVPCAEGNGRLPQSN
jgi:hypothetical protein